MAATTSTPSPYTMSTSAQPLGGSNPPTWALVGFRDDGEREPDRQGSPATAPTAVTDVPVPVSVASPSQPPKMSSPQDFTFLKELGCGSWSTVRPDL